VLTRRVTGALNLEPGDGKVIVLFTGTVEAAGPGRVWLRVDEAHASHADGRNWTEWFTAGREPLIGIEDYDDDTTM
jgi:hypothetical protein